MVKASLESKKAFHKGTPEATSDHPLLPAAFLPRYRLFALLNEGLHRRLTLVIAPAGYGKTILLASWLNQVVKKRGLPYGWLSLSSQDVDVTRLLLSLGQALASLKPDLPESLGDLLSSAPFTHWVEALTFLIQKVAESRTRFFLIVDDVHLLEASEEAIALLDRLLAEAPPGFHIVLASRRRPPLSSIPRLRVQDQVIELGADDLRFTRGEVLSLFWQVHQMELPERLLSELAERTEGWVVALELARQFVNRYGVQKAEETFRLSPAGDLYNLYEYFARIVVDGQPPETRAFLRRTSILERLRPELCDYILERSDSAAILGRLERSGLFTFPDDLTRMTYRYHTLFRGFLRRRLLEVEGTQVMRGLHRRAASWLLEQGEDEEAVEHLLAAEEYEAAAELFRSLRGRLFLTSRYHLLERWLERFPPSVSEAHPWLLLTRARLALLRGERSQAYQLCLQARPLLQAQQDHIGLYTVYHDLAELSKGWGDFSQAEVLYRRAMEYAADDSQRAVCLGQIARCMYLRGGDVEESLRLLERGMELAERNGWLLGRAGLLSLKGRMLSSTGDFKGAIEAWDTALELMEAYGNRHQQASILTNMAYLHCLLGEFDQAETLVHRALELERRFGLELQYAYSLNIQGVVHQGRGEWEAARRCHEEALRIQRRLNERYEVPVTLNWLSLLARREGRLEEALRYGEESLSLRKKLSSEYEIGLTLIELGAAYFALNRLAQARRLWQQALDIFLHHRACYEQAQLHFYLAALAHRQGDARGEAEHLKASLELARRYGYRYLYVQDSPWAAPLLLPLALEGEPFATEVFLRLGEPARELLLRVIEEDDAARKARAAHLLGEMGDEKAVKLLASLERDPSPQVRRAAGVALRKLLARPPLPLRVQTLGGFRLWRGEREITRWPRRSARDLLLLLLAHYPHPVPIEALAEALWPQSLPRKARQNLRRAVSDLRHTLEPELPAAFPSRYIVTGEETYALALPEGSWVDAWAFEEELSAALELPCNTPEGRRKAVEALEKALSLYGGDYLPEVPYEDWVSLRRERLRERYLAGLRRLARLCLEQGDIRGALEAGYRALEIDPWDEDSVLLLMEAHQAQGNVPAALRLYEAFRDRLKRDIDLPPRDDLTALYKALRGR